MTQGAVEWRVAEGLVPYELSLREMDMRAEAIRARRG